MNSYKFNSKKKLDQKVDKNLQDNPKLVTVVNKLVKIFRKNMNYKHRILNIFKELNYDFYISLL